MPSDAQTGEPTLSEQHPGGFYIGFNHAIDRRSMEQLLATCSQAIQQGGFRRVILALNSGGGFLDQAHYAVNILGALPSDIEIVTHNVGNVASAANLLFVCGQRRLVAPGSTFFFHQTFFELGAGERITEPVAAAKLKGIQEEDLRAATIIATRTGSSVEEVRGWQNAEKVMSAQEALECGLVHAIEPLQIPPDALFHQLTL